VEDQFKLRVGRTSRGVKQAGFVFLWRTTMPSVLIETGFLTNSTEEKFLANEQGQDLIASGIYRAFKEYKSDVESIN
jgi:N-acetylmuramoyl-L-alanine amidase